ncbi:MAG: hypothetical protein JNK78_07255 [Planctomycetes bacterium]|nr:hypothetical protein [Planctomycetota bacterium]
MGLLHADLRSLGNLATTRTGRRTLGGALVGLVTIALMWWSTTSVLLESRHLGTSLQSLLATALMPCPIVATWLGLSLAQRQLFESAELPLWRLAPIPPWRGAIEVGVRAAFVTLAWASAMSLPFVTTLLLRTQPAPALAWALVPVALVCCTVPVLGTILSVQIVLVRFFSGRVLRIVLTIVAALASVGFSAWLLVGLFTTSAPRVATAGAPAIAVPWIVDTCAEMLASAATGENDTTPLRFALGWLGLTAAIFWFAARLHPGAAERHLATAPATLRRRSAWPSAVAAVVRRKEFAQVLQQPVALMGFVAFGALVWVLVRERVFVAGILAQRGLQPDVAHLGAMVMQWFLAVLLVLYAHMGRLVLWDGPQWSLWTTAPASPWAIVRGKLQSVALLLLWPLLLVAVIAGRAYGASSAVTLTFVATTLGGTLAALGVLAVVGTSPRLMRPDLGGAMAQGGRSFLAAMLLVLLFEFAMSPAVFAWSWLTANVHTAAAARAAFVWVAAGAWALGLAVGGVGVALGVRNFRRLCAPQ